MLVAFRPACQNFSRCFPMTRLAPNTSKRCAGRTALSVRKAASKTNLVRLPSALEAQVVSSTRDMVLRDDLTVFQNLVQGKVEFALSALLKYLLRTTPLKIQVVTTNYDRIAEYACDVATLATSQAYSAMRS